MILRGDDANEEASQAAFGLRGSDEPVELPPAEYSLGTVLTRWRAAERRLAEVPAGTPEFRAVEKHIEAYKADYQRLFAEQVGDDDDPDTDSSGPTAPLFSAESSSP